MSNRFLGVFLNCLYAQIEGVDRVLDNIQRMGAQAICLTPKIAWPTADGVRFPDLHVDGHQRLVARPVWGGGEAHIKTAYPFEPNRELYQVSHYRPPDHTTDPQQHIEMPHRVIAEAKRRGMRVHLLFHPFLPPGVRDRDRPVTIDGAHPIPPLVAHNACLNAPDAEAYGLALMQDLVQHYPEIDGLIPDWVEFGAYRLPDLFGCFCPHCERTAREAGLDWERMRQDVRATWEGCHRLTHAELRRSRRMLQSPSALVGLLAKHPGWTDLLRFKASTVRRFYERARATLVDMERAAMPITARGWPPPWNRASGMDYGSLTDLCATVAPKLFTFDYCAIPRWYGETLQAWNPELDESEVLDTLVEWLNLPDENSPRSFSQYNIPAPGEAHPALMEAYGQRLDEVSDQVGGRALFCPIAHAYLPEHQWRDMLTTLHASRADGVWVHMYGYLSDQKMESVREVWT